MAKKRIKIAKDFSRSPAGRYREDGPFSGQRFREEYLRPSLKESYEVEIDLDGTFGYGSSFLEEAFGGLIRAEGYEKNELKRRLKIISSDPSYEDEVWEYLGFDDGSRR